MTKYQRGELMEGWNDCPPAMGSRDSSSSSVSSVRSKRRAPRPQAVMPESTRTPPTGVSRPLPPTLGPPTSGLRPPTAAAATASLSARPSDVDLEATPDILRQILAQSGLDEKHQCAFIKRVVETYSQLEERHQRFLSGVAAQLSRQEDSANIKNEILKYMMVHSGVSTWCVPLKKLVESTAQ